MLRSQRIRPQASRRGSILVELALVAIVGYIFFAGVITYARLFFGAQIVQNAADICARETSRMPLPGNITFEDLLNQDPAVIAQYPSIEAFRDEIYDELFLAPIINAWISAPTMSLPDYLAEQGMPVVNKALVPLMFVEKIGPFTLLRYPGALATATRGGAFGLTVVVPIVTSRSPTGTETIVWSRVIEEVDAEAPGNVNLSEDPFQVTSPEAGMVQVRVNYPYQAGSMVSFQRHDETSTSPSVTGDPVPLAFSIRNQADDAGTTDLGVGFPPFTSLFMPPAEGQDPSQVYGGTYGLGALQAFTEQVRPFRRVLSAQSFHRREVFE